MSRYRQPGHVTRGTARRTGATSARRANEYSGQRWLRCLGRLTVVAIVHIVGIWFLANTGQNLLGLLIGLLALSIILASFTGKTASKVTGNFVSAITGAVWGAYLNLWAWGLGLRLKKSKKRQEDDDD